MQEREKEDRRVKTKSMEWESMMVGRLTLMQGGKNKSRRKKRQKKRHVTETAEERGAQRKEKIKRLQESFSTQVSMQEGTKEQKKDKNEWRKQVVRNNRLWRAWPGAR